LLLLAAAQKVPCAVATVDHGLRPESTDEAAAVATLCTSFGLAHTVLTLNLAPGPGVQARARTGRYAALGDWASATGLGAVVTAHHADDQAETLVMRLNRGAGVRGLAAMRRASVVPGRPHCPLLRPLLGWRRTELADVVSGSGVNPTVDPSNHDMRFERARLRADLASASWLDVGAVGASASHLAEADMAIEWAAARDFESAARSGPTLEWSPGDAPRVVVLRVLEHIVAEFGCAAPRGSALARWHDQLAAGGIATLANIRGDGRKAVWRFVKAPPRRSRECP
jgi:tRNA(Ile)-lysidine synthase